MYLVYNLSVTMPKLQFIHFSPRLPPVHRLCDCVLGAQIQSADSDLVLFSGHHPSDRQPACPRRLCCGYCLWQMYCQPYAQGERGLPEPFSFSHCLSLRCVNIFFSGFVFRVTTKSACNYPFMFLRSRTCLNFNIDNLFFQTHNQSCKPNICLFELK